MVPWLLVYCLSTAVAATSHAERHGALVPGSATLLTAAAASYDQLRARSKKTCQHYVFGFSNGHVGTTTMDDHSFYHDPESTTGFGFEVVGLWKHGPWHAWRAPSTVAEEVQFVNSTYLPALWKATSPGGAQKKACVDLSHTNLFFFRGLLKVLREANLPFKLVRVRRDAVELALSLLTQVPTGGAGPDHLVTAYRPFEAPGARVLQLKGDPRATWNKLTDFQKALWMIDEVEAQWLRNIDANAKKGSLTVDWSRSDQTHGDPFVENAAKPVAKFLGLPLKSHVGDKKQHTDGKKVDARVLKTDLHHLHAYQSMMLAECVHFHALAPQLPTSRAIAGRRAALEALEGKQEDARASGAVTDSF